MAILQRLENKKKMRGKIFACLKIDFCSRWSHWLHRWILSFSQDWCHHECPVYHHILHSRADSIPMAFWQCFKSRTGAVFPIWPRFFSWKSFFSLNIFYSHESALLFMRSIKSLNWWEAGPYSDAPAISNIVLGGSGYSRSLQNHCWFSARIQSLYSSWEKVETSSWLTRIICYILHLWRRNKSAQFEWKEIEF